MVGKLDIRLLGGFQILYENKPLSLQHSKRLQSLLAFLVLHRQTPQSRQYLAFRFWPDSSESQALTNLRQLLYHLRQVLPDLDSFFHIDNQSIHWKEEADYSLDVAEFEKCIALVNSVSEKKDNENNASLLEKTAELYRGDLFTECYESWIEPIRKRLRNEYISVLLRLIEVHEDNRNYQKAVFFAERLLNCDNYREKTYLDLMRLHALNDNRSKALQLYRQCEEVLDHELGVEPARETRNLYERLIEDHLPGTNNDDVQNGKSTGNKWPLIGRRDEWKILLNSWKEVLEGSGKFVCISGEPGIGKSRLGMEFRESVKRQGYSTAYTRSYETAGILSYGPVTDWLREEPFHKYLADLEPVWLKVIARIFPELLIEFPELPDPGPLNEKWQRLHFFEALTKAFLTHEKSKLLFLDDLQWCDRETLEWIDYLFHSKETSNLLVVGTLRPVEGASNKPLQTLLASLRTDECIPEIHLNGLNETESKELATCVAGNDSSPDPDIFKESEGNPLFVVEMVRQESYKGKEKNFGRRRLSEKPISGTNINSALLPPKVHQVISARFDQLTERTRELMWLAAVIGRELRLDILMHASGREETPVVTSLEELLQHHIIRELRSGIYDFTHDKLREVAYHKMSNARKRLLHRKIADAIEKVHAGNLQTYSNALALHYDRGEMWMQSINYYQEAAVYARQILADREALSYLNRASTLLHEISDETVRDDTELNILTGKTISLVHLKGYSSDDVQHTCNRVREISKKTEKTSPIPILRTLAISNLTINRLDAAYELGLEIYNHAKKTGNNVEWVEAHYVLGVTQDRMGEYTGAAAYLKGAVDNYNPEQQEIHIRVYGQDPFVICKVRWAFVLWKLGKKERGERLCLEALETAKALNHSFSLDYVRFIVAWMYNLQDDIRRTQQVTKEMIRSSANHGFKQWHAFGKLLLGWTLCRQDRSTEGIKWMRDGLADLDNIAYTLDRPYFNCLLARELVFQDETEEAISLIQSALEMIEDSGERWMEAEVNRISGEIYLQTDPCQVEKAKSSFRKAITVARHQKAISFEERALESLEKLK